MKAKMLLIALGALMLGAPGVMARAMPAAGLQQAASTDVVQVYHRRGKPHRRARITVYPQQHAGPFYGTPYYYDDLGQYPYVRGFGDRNPVPRGNMRGCTVDLGYGRYAPCD